MNLTWATTLLKGLQRCGLEHVFIAPGSRSTPLTIAAASNPALKKTVHYDERGLTFAALGVGKATGKPAVVITTSGTAVANCFPAVVEASMSGTPLMILSADRPAELRGSGSNQTIDQVEIFGGYPRYFVDLESPSSSTPLTHLAAIAAEAFTQSRDGPTHINLQFNEPLYDPGDRVPKFNDPIPGAKAEVTAAVDSIALTRAIELINQAKSGLVVCGEMSVRGDFPHLNQFLEKLGWPVLFDVASPLRYQQHHRFPTFRHYDLYKDTLRPDLVLHVGNSVVSKKLLIELKVPTVRLSPGRVPFDPHGVVWSTLTGSLEDIAQKLAARVSAHGSALTDNLVAEEEASIVSLSNELKNSEFLDERRAVQLTLEDCAANTPVFFGNSLTIRVANRLLTKQVRLEPYVSRGASGIDGLIATSAGIATGCGRRTISLIGDLAFLHDQSSLPLLRELPLTLVVINNNGGQIFKWLPIAKQTPHFDKYFLTPHNLQSLRPLVEGHGLPYRSAATTSELRAAVSAAAGSKDPMVIEVIIK